MSVTATMEHLVTALEVVVAAELVLGLLWSCILSWRLWRRTRDGRAAYRTLREAFGGVLLLGLEILVAADLVRTVAVQPTLANLTTLGILVLIRTFLSFALEIEIEGVPPWRRLAATGPDRVAQAAERARKVS